MKKIYICGLVSTVLTFCINPSHKTYAADFTSMKCVAQVASNKTDWNAKCGKISVSGKSTCINMPGDKPYATTGIFQLSNNNDRLDCWCKMTSPNESAWIFLGAYPSASDCDNNCMDNCAVHMQLSQEFRKAFTQ